VRKPCDSGGAKQRVRARPEEGYQAAPPNGEEAWGDQVNSRCGTGIRLTQETTRPSPQRGYSSGWIMRDGWQGAHDAKRGLGWVRRRCWRLRQLGEPALRIVRR